MMLHKDHSFVYFRAVQNHGNINFKQEILLCFSKKWVLSSVVLLFTILNDSRYSKNMAIEARQKQQAEQILHA